MFEYIKSDLYRLHGKISVPLFLRTFMRNYGFRKLVIFRLQNMREFCTMRIIFQFLFPGNRISIPRTTKIGYGFYIGHNGQ